AHALHRGDGDRDRLLDRGALGDHHLRGTAPVLRLARGPSRHEPAAGRGGGRVLRPAGGAVRPPPRRQRPTRGGAPRGPAGTRPPRRGVAQWNLNACTTPGACRSLSPGPTPTPG